MNNESQENPKTKWAFAIIRFFFFQFVVCGTMFRAATSFCGWGERPLENRVMLIVDITIMFAAFTVAFLDNTATKLLHLKKDKTVLGQEPTPISD